MGGGESRGGEKRGEEGRVTSHFLPCTSCAKETSSQTGHTGEEAVMAREPGEVPGIGQLSSSSLSYDMG